MASLDKLITDLQEQQRKAQAANQQRLDQIMGMYDKIIEMYQPGGEYMKGAESALERERTKTMAQGMQSLVGRGLSGTTLPQTFATQFSEQVAAPMLAQIQDQRMDRLTQAMTGQAGVLERVEDTGPDYGLIAQLALQAGRQPTGGTFRSSSMAPRQSFFSQPLMSEMGSYSTPTTPQFSASYQPAQPQQPSGSLRQQPLSSQQWAAFDLGYGPVNQTYAQQLHANAYQPLPQPTLSVSKQTTFADLAKQSGFVF